MDPTNQRIVIPGRKLVRGDVIAGDASRRTVTQIRPLPGVLRSVLGEGTRVAHSDTGWTSVVCPGDPVAVALPRPDGAS